MGEQYYKTLHKSTHHWGVMDNEKVWGIMLSEWPLTCPWEYLRKESLKYQAWAKHPQPASDCRQAKGLEKSSSCIAIADPFACTQSSMSQFTKLIKMELLCLQPVQKVGALSIQPSLIPWGNIYMGMCQQWRNWGQRKEDNSTDSKEKAREF